MLQTTRRDDRCVQLHTIPSCSRRGNHLRRPKIIYLHRLALGVRSIFTEAAIRSATFTSRRSHVHPVPLSGVRCPSPRSIANPGIQLPNGTSAMWWRACQQGPEGPLRFGSDSAQPLRSIRCSKNWYLIKRCRSCEDKDATRGRIGSADGASAIRETLWT